MKCLLIVTSVIKVGAGLALLCWPSAAVKLLLGSALDALAAAHSRAVARLSRDIADAVRALGQ